VPEDPDPTALLGKQRVNHGRINCINKVLRCYVYYQVRAWNAGGDEDTSTCSQQYCSVQEFSAPEGQVYLPYWLMQSLHISEGGSVVVTSIVNLPRGIYCRLQPESSSFLELAADIGPKVREFNACDKTGRRGLKWPVLVVDGDSTAQIFRSERQLDDRDRVRQCAVLRSSS
jgi:hypothetical protein